MKPLALLSVVVVSSVMLACTRDPGAESRGRRSEGAHDEADERDEAHAPASAEANGEEALPPGHPPLEDWQVAEGAAPPEGELPPGHPPTAGELPPGHPPTAGELPPGHPTTGGGAPPAAGAFDPAHPSVGGVAWMAAAPLRYRQPSSAMRAAEYVVEGASDDTVLTVFYFPGGGGGIDANVQRWVGQLEGGEPRITRNTVNGLPITRVDVTGTFNGGMGIGAGEVPAGDHRMLAAIAEGPSGPVFFKLIGPAATVTRAARAFEGLVTSLHAG